MSLTFQSFDDQASATHGGNGAVYYCEQTPKAELPCQDKGRDQTNNQQRPSEQVGDECAVREFAKPDSFDHLRASTMANQDRTVNIQ